MITKRKRSFSWNVQRPGPCPALPGALHFSGALVLLLASKLIAADPWQPSGVLARISTYCVGTHLIIPVLVDNKECEFLIDTGSSITLLDDSFAPALRRAASQFEALDTLGDKLTVAKYKAPSIRIGNSSCAWLSEIGCTNLRKAATAIGSRLSGIVGMDVLSRYVVHIDFDAGVILFCDPAKCGMPPGAMVPMEFGIGGAPCILGRVGETLTVFRVDTGCIGTGEVKTETVAALEKTRMLIPTGISQTVMRGDGSVVSENLGRIVVLTIGDTPYKDLVVSSGAWNLLGLSFLCRHRVTFDFPNGRLYLATGIRFGSRDRSDQDGIQLERDIVQRIIPGSVADRAGFREGDRISKIASFDMERLGQTSIKTLLTTLLVNDLEFSVVRDGKPVVVSVSSR